MQFRAEPFFVAYRAPSLDASTLRPRAAPATFLSPVQAFEHLAVRAVEPERGTFTRFADNDVLSAARAAMPDNGVGDTAWLDEYDDYYYSRDRALPLPVLRLRFDDPRQTWLYVDPYRGVIFATRRAAHPPQPLALSRPAQPGLSISLLPAPLVGRCCDLVAGRRASC